MNRIIRICILITALVLIFSDIIAEEMKISEVIETVMEQNLQIQLEKLEAQYHADISKSVRGKYLPALKLSASALFWNDENKAQMDLPVLNAVIQEIVPALSPDSQQRIQNVIEENGNSGITIHEKQSYKVSATIIQPLASLYGVYHSHNSALKMKKAAEYDTMKIKQELQKEIAKLYFGMLSATEMVKSFDAAIDQIEKTEFITEALINEGRVEPNALLRLKVQRSDFEKGKLSVLKTIENSKMVLNMLMNRDIDAPFKPVWNYSDFQSKVKDIVSAKNQNDTLSYVEDNPEIKSLKEKVEASISYKHSAISSFLPELNLVLNYDFQEGFGDMQPQNQFYAGIHFNWNIWEWGSGYYKIRATETQSAKMKLSLALLKSKTIVEIGQLKNNLETSLAEVENAELQTKYAKESFRIEEELYRSGNSSTTDLLQAQTNALKAQNDLNIKQ
ncbi:MAG TPA: TolC family protein, partial [bacterium]|nr:TolC family protein [bacterium]